MITPIFLHSSTGSVPDLVFVFFTIAMCEALISAALGMIAFISDSISDLFFKLSVGMGILLTITVLVGIIVVSIFAA